ncbi:MAG: hypothetical protein GY869_26745 [Planctomycetes bacterium]|nr:hypothetical protein [Planctomycetota bacterium]
MPITKEATLKQFIKVTWGVTIPDTQVCPNHSTPWQAFCDAYFARSSVSVWKASRGFGGKSYLLALLGLTEAVTLAADVNILGGSGQQSDNVLSYNVEHWGRRSAPRHLLVGKPGTHKITLTTGNFIKSLTASQTSVRGPHPQKLRLDEIDEMPLPIFDAAMGQPMDKTRDGILIPSQTVASSTHQYANGTMTEILRRAKDKGWPVFEWCYKETSAVDGWLTAQEIERKRNDVTAAMWAAEYDLQEPSPGTRAIQPDKVKAMFDRSLGEYRGANGQLLIFEQPIKGAQYATGADWNKKKDWTVIITIRTDCNPMRVVAFERVGRMDWPTMVGKYEKRLKMYGRRAAHDQTGLGDVVNDYAQARGRGVIMVGRQRSDMLSNYISAIERGEIVSPMIDFMYSDHLYASVDDVFGSGHLPDSIAAGSLMLEAKGKVQGIW